MKIFGVGKNYQEHNVEMKSSNPDEPVIFLMPDTSLLRVNRPFYIPDFSNEIHHEVELVVKINRIGRHVAPKFAHRYYDEIGLGVDFTARDIQSKLKERGLPWEISKAFDNATAIGQFLPKEQLGDINQMPFRLDIDGKTAQSGNSSQMLFDIDHLIAYISRFFTIKIGDLIFTGTPSGVAPVAIGNRLEGYIRDEKMFDFMIK